MKLNQEIVQLITKLPSWVSVVVGIVSTVIVAVSLFQQNLVIATLTLAVILWLACLYVWAKQTESPIIGGREIPAFPRWRRFAFIGIVLIPIATIVGSGVWLLNPADRADNPCQHAQITYPSGAPQGLSADSQISSPVEIGWDPPECVMTVEFYQVGKLWRSYRNATSGQRFNIGSADSGETQIQIWVAGSEGIGEPADSIWVWVK